MDYLSLIDEFRPEAWLRAGAALAICALLIPASMPAAKRLGLVDHPGGRKQHEHPIPVVGGIAILVAMVVTYLVFEAQWGVRMFGFIGGAIMLVAVGQLDDARDLRWTWRIGVQALAALLMFYVAGVQATNLQDVFGFGGANIGLFAVPFTIFIVVGVINALNMADGVDGLAGSLALVSLLLFTSFALYAGDGVLAERLLTLSAAVVGFLVWNLRFPWQPRARVFLGNGGSMLLGFVIAWASVRLTQNAEHPVSPVLGPWTLALPLIDCVSLMFRRWRQGRSPFSADRNHMHHLMLDAGYRPGTVVMLLAGISLLLGVLAAVAVKLGVYRPLVVIAFLVLLVGWYGFSCERDRAVARLAAFRSRRAVDEPPAEPTPPPMPSADS